MGRDERETNPELSIFRMKFGKPGKQTSTPLFSNPVYNPVWFYQFHFSQDISLVNFKHRYLALTDHVIPLSCFSSHVLNRTEHDRQFVIEIFEIVVDQMFMVVCICSLHSRSVSEMLL